MIEAALLLAAIELNGALISRGATAMLSDTQCAIEFATIAPSLSESARADRRGDYWVGKPEYCSYSESDMLLRVRIPQELLAHKTLTLSESSGVLSVALLHDTAALSQHPEFASQPTPAPIPAAAFDLFAGSGLRALGTVLSAGPWSAQALYQESESSPASQRLTLEYFSKTGAHTRAGDFRTDYGVEQTFGEFRGLSLSSRAAPLRGEGKAQASLAIENPARVQFFDRNGTAVYSSEILPPGNYQIQGYGASTIPGFLEARLIDVNGMVQSVALPWSADRRIMSAAQSEWELFSGYGRYGENALQEKATHSARFRHGVTQHLTAGFHADQHGDFKRWAFEASTRALPSLIGTAAFGQSCERNRCKPTYMFETRADVYKKAFVLAKASRTITQTPDAQPRDTLQLSISGSLHQRVSGSLHLVSDYPQGEPAQHAQTVSANLRLSPMISLQLQARHQLFANEGSSWVSSLGLTVHFSSVSTTVHGGMQTRSHGAPQTTETDYTVQASKSSPTAYGPQISLAHTQGRTNRSDAFGRYASRYGDASARIDSLRNRLDWSASTRLWITSKAATFAPAGDHNLVIHQLGIPAVKIEHAGTEGQITNTKGIALFRKSPAWTDSRYAIDSKTVPFGINLNIGAVKIPLALHRAYFVDYRALWSAAHSWQIANIHELPTLDTAKLTDRTGKPLFVAPDGYVDLQSSEQLPITLKPQIGQTLQCEAAGVQQFVTVLYCRGETL